MRESAGEMGERWRIVGWELEGSNAGDCGRDGREIEDSGVGAWGRYAGEWGKDGG